MATTVAVVGGRHLTAPAGSSASLTRLPDLLPASLQHLEMLAIIGYGAYAQVAEVKSRKTGDHYALKVVEKQPLAARGMLQQLAREFGVQRGVRHPHTVQAVDLAEDTQHAYLLLELCVGGSVWQATHRFHNAIVPEPTAAQWLSDATVGCAHLHELGLVHRDVKLENLLIDGAGYVKLCDFGWCAFEADEPQGMCGTPQLAAPEVSQGDSQTSKVDAWALGACLVQLLKGRPLAGTQDAWLPRSASVHAKDVGSGFLTVDASARLSAREALDFPFIKAYRRLEQEKGEVVDAVAVMTLEEASLKADSEEVPPLVPMKSPTARSPRVVRRQSAPSHPMQQETRTGKSLPAPTRLVSGSSSARQLPNTSSTNAHSLRRLYSQPPQQEKRGSSPAPVMGGAAATQARLSQMTFKAPSKPNQSESPRKNPSTPTPIDSPKRLAAAAAAAAGAAPDIIASVKAKGTGGQRSSLGSSYISPSPRLRLSSPDEIRARYSETSSLSARIKAGLGRAGGVQSEMERRALPADSEVEVGRKKEQKVPEVKWGESQRCAEKSPRRVVLSVREDHSFQSAKVKKLAQEALQVAASLTTPDAGDPRTVCQQNRTEEEALLRNFLSSPSPKTSSASAEKAMDAARRYIEISQLLAERSRARCAAAMVESASRAA